MNQNFPDVSFEINNIKRKTIGTVIIEKCEPLKPQ